MTRSEYISSKNIPNSNSLKKSPNDSSAFVDVIPMTNNPIRGGEEYLYIISDLKQF